MRQEPQHQDGPVTTHLPGIFQGLMAGGLASAILPGISFYWKLRLHEEPPEWAKGVLPSLIGGIVVFLTYVSAKVGRSILHKRAHALVKAKGNKISVYIAEFGEDEEAREAYEHLSAAILREIGDDCIEVLPAGKEFIFPMTVSGNDAPRKIAEEARKLLKKNDADLLLWGRIERLSGQPRLGLRFVGASQDGAEKKSFGFHPEFDLDLDFGPEMATAVAGAVVALTVGVDPNPSRYVGDVLEPLAAKLRPLARRPPPSMRREQKFSMLFTYALIEQNLGVQRGVNDGLMAAAAAYRRSLECCEGDADKSNWAMTQNNLGNALVTLGERESGASGIARLEEAVAAYREALKEYTRERVPLDWAMTQNNLGTALWTLGERESGASGVARLQEAVAAYREALKEYTRERVPLDWAMTQNNLGAALRTLGARESGASGVARLQEAVAAYREALKEYTRERVPLQWATTQNNLGNALQTLGVRESGASGVARLDEAVAAYRNALKERTRERVPLDWAMTQNNLGAALRTLGARESGASGIARLEKAVAAFREALKECTRERVPLQWAMTQQNLALVFLSIDEREPGCEALRQARTAYRDALEVYTEEHSGFDWKHATADLAEVERVMAERGCGETD